jgi:hypothetical protein
MSVPKSRRLLGCEGQNFHQGLKLSGTMVVLVLLIMLNTLSQPFQSFGRVAQVHFCSFLLTVFVDEKIPLLKYTGR